MIEQHVSGFLRPNFVVLSLGVHPSDCVKVRYHPLVFLAAAGYPDLPNFGLPPKILRKNVAAENATEF